MSLVVHAGGSLATRDDLALVPVPEATDSCIPVPHIHLAERLSTIGRDILTDFRLENEQFALARDGNQMFGFLTFKRDHEEMGLSIGFRNSYDKSMAVGIAIGATVFVCDNLALAGEASILRKHTVNVWSSLEDLAISTLYRSRFGKIVKDSEVMKTRELTDTEAFMLLGLLYGRRVLSLRQLSFAKLEWLNPSREAFQSRNLWSFYNACTEILKGCPPLMIMEKYIGLHNVVMGGVNGFPFDDRAFYVFLPIHSYSSGVV